MAYYKHWTSITRSGEMFAAHCTGCDWNTVAATRPDAVKACREHQHEAGEQRENDERPPEERFKRRYYSRQVLKLVHMALNAEDDAKAEAIIAEARQLYRSERAA